MNFNDKIFSRDLPGVKNYVSDLIVLLVQVSLGIVNADVDMSAKLNPRNFLWNATRKS